MSLRNEKFVRWQPKTPKILFFSSMRTFRERVNSEVHTGHERGADIILEWFGGVKYNNVLSSKSASPPLS